MNWVLGSAAQQPWTWLGWAALIWGAEARNSEGPLRARLPQLLKIWTKVDSPYPHPRGNELN